MRKTSKFFLTTKFPNGRCLEDDVTRIELQAISRVVLAVIDLWYDDYDPMSSPSPVTQDLVDVLSYTTGVEENDTTFRSSFPYVQLPWSGTGKCIGTEVQPMARAIPTMNVAPPAALMVPSQVSEGVGLANPFKTSTAITYNVTRESDINVYVYDLLGKLITMLDSGIKSAR